MYKTRIKKIQTSLKDKQLESLLIENPTDIYYLTGQKVTKGSLFITSKKALFRLDGRYLEKCRKTSPVEIVDEEKTPLKKLFKGVSEVFFDSDFTSYGRVLTLRKEKGIAFKPMKDFLFSFRAIKDSDEIKLLTKAIELGAKGHAYLLGLLEPGSREIDLQSALKIFLLEEAQENASFDPIVAFGKNSALPHHTSGLTKLQKSDQVLIDMGACFHMYCSDFTRTHYFGGKRPKKLQEIYDVVKEAKEAAEFLLKPGTSFKELDKAARDVIDQAGFSDYYPHGLGHGVGIDIHEPPFIGRKSQPFMNQMLEPGMVITIEPGIYIPSLGGVRLEDMVLINEQGFQNLTKPYLTEI